jgi:di/tripeptidase
MKLIFASIFCLFFIRNVRVSEFGIVYATIPGNLPDNSKVPVIGFIAHMDTSPAVSGENVNPIFHKNYQGANGREVSGSEDHDRRQRELQEHEGSAQGPSSVDDECDGSG